MRKIDVLFQGLKSAFSKALEIELLKKGIEIHGWMECGPLIYQFTHEHDNVRHDHRYRGRNIVAALSALLWPWWPFIYGID